MECSLPLLSFLSFLHLIGVNFPCTVISAKMQGCSLECFEGNTAHGVWSDPEFGFSQQFPENTEYSHEKFGLPESKLFLRDLLNHRSWELWVLQGDSRQEWVDTHKSQVQVPVWMNPCFTCGPTFCSSGRNWNTVLSPSKKREASWLVDSGHPAWFRSRWGGWVFL